MDRRQEREQTFELSKEKRVVLLSTFKAVTKCVYNYCVQRCDIYAPIPYLQPIDINLSIVIENR